MVAAVATSPTSLSQKNMMGSAIAIDPSSVGTVARKRRRQILQSQRQMKTAEPDPKKQCTGTVGVGVSEGAVGPVVLSADGGAGSITEPMTVTPPGKTHTAPRKVSHCDGIAPPVNADSSITKKTTTTTTTTTSTNTKANSKTKRPQMRYEPDVPMTKEEAAIWRREQRRKRNRESAAASRQRQRDRIAELEKEVDGWKEKFEAAMQRLRHLEEANSLPKTELGVVASKVEDDCVVTPCPSPELSEDASPPQTLSGNCLEHEEQESEQCKATQAQQEEIEEHLKEKHSLPA